MSEGEPEITPGEPVDRGYIESRVPEAVESREPGREEIEEVAEEAGELATEQVVEEPGEESGTTEAAEDEEDDADTPPPTPPVPPPTAPPPRPPAPPPGPPPPGLTADMRIQAELAHIRIETVEKALAAGFEDPVNYLARSRHNPEMVTRIESRGWDMSPPPPVNPPRPEDPVLEVGQAGSARRDHLTDIYKGLESLGGRQEIKRDLRRPGTLPLGLHNMPVVGPKVAKRILAWRMFHHEREHRPKTGEFVMPNGTKETRQIIYNDGLRGLGVKKVREILDYLDAVDKDVLVQRSKLSQANAHELMDDTGAPRRNIAYLIDRDIRALESIDRLEFNPAGFYEHAPFKTALKTYNEMEPRKVAEERNEFVRLRQLGVRSPNQEKRFRELQQKHTTWT